MNFRNMLRTRLGAWEEWAEPFLDKIFFFFGPPLERNAFLKAILIVFTVHRAISALLFAGVLWIYDATGTSVEASPVLPSVVLLLFVLPFTAVLYRRLLYLGISFPFMGVGILSGLLASMYCIPGDFYWHPYHLAFQLGIVLPLSFKTRQETDRDGPVT